MTLPAYTIAIAFTAAALAYLALCGLLLRAGQRRAIVALGCLTTVVLFAGVLLYTFNLVPVGIAVLLHPFLFLLVATLIAIAVLRGELRYTGQWVLLGIGLLIACAAAQPDLLRGTLTTETEVALMIGGFYIMAQTPRLLGRFLDARRFGRAARWWSAEDSYNLLLYLLMVATALLWQSNLALGMYGLAFLLALRRPGLLRGR